MPVLIKEENNLQLQDNRTGTWSNLVRQLHRLRLAGLVAALLEGGSAFTTIAAQALYVGAPSLDGWLGRDKMTDVARKLEDPTAVDDLVRALREEAA